MDKIVIINNSLIFSDAESQKDAVKQNHYSFRDIPELDQYWKDGYYVVQITPITLPSPTNIFTASIVLHLRNSK